MNILSIETSCDETAISVVQVVGDFPNATYTIRGDALRSQISSHQQYGGVFPNVAKRDHAAIIMELLTVAFEEAHIEERPARPLSDTERDELKTLLEREPAVYDALLAFHEVHGRPLIDAIAVTTGPGLEPALWVGINTARALAVLWNIPLIPVNHLEGHIFASLFQGDKLAPLTFPALALIVSGGHTEFIVMHDWHKYEKVGQTRDDAIGEAFDKVARLIGLPYPGGPEISRLAERARKEGLKSETPLPRPMIDSHGLDVSFSGIKTAVRYAVQDLSLSETEQAAIAREFEDAVVEVLVEKTKRAVDQYNVSSLIVGGGVSANRHLRESLTATFQKEYPSLTLYIPQQSLTTDNSVMIALAGHAHVGDAVSPGRVQTIRAEGNKQHRRAPIGSSPF